MKKYLPLLIIGLTFLFLAAGKKKDSQPLGPVMQLIIQTADLNASTAFWESIGYKLILEGSGKQVWRLMSDENFDIVLTQGDIAYTQLTYYTTEFAKTQKRLKKAKILPFTEPKDENGKVFSAAYMSPDSVYIGMVDRDPTSLHRPSNKNMMALGADLMNPDKIPGQIGAFGEYSQCVADLKVSVAYWEKLGFKHQGIQQVPYPWTVMTDGVLVVGLHQTTDFSGAAITYFAPDMGKRIEALKAKGIVVEEFGMGPNNVIATAPEGTKLFLFSL